MTSRHIVVTLTDSEYGALASVVTAGHADMVAATELGHLTQTPLKSLRSGWAKLSAAWSLGGDGEDC